MKSSYKKAKGLRASEGGKGESYRFTNIRGGLCGTRESTSLKFSGKTDSKHPMKVPVLNEYILRVVIIPRDTKVAVIL